MKILILLYWLYDSYNFLKCKEQFLNAYNIDGESVPLL